MHRSTLRKAGRRGLAPGGSTTLLAGFAIPALVVSLVLGPGTVEQASASTPLEKGTQTITPHGIGRVHLGATVGALHRWHLIRGLRPGCEVDPGQRVARLRPPLSGFAIFTNGRRHLTSILITGGAATAKHIGIGSTPTEARQAYPQALYKPPGSFAPFAEGFLWVNDIANPKLTFIVDPETDLVREVDVPYPNFCE